MSKANNHCECTRAQFDLLPALVSRATFIAWTGLDDKDVTEGIRAGTIQVHRRPGRKKVRYFKREIGRFCGF